MLRGQLLLILIVLVIPCSAQKSAAQTKAPAEKAASTAEAKPATARLPVKRVVLYKNGVGYFEHAATSPEADRIGFTTGQLNDVLKSLTAVDMGDGRTRRCATTQCSAQTSD